MPTLIELNALRTALGMKPLKAWKESKDKLAAAIKKLTGGKESTATVTKVSTGMTAAKVEAAAKKAAKPAKAKPAKAKTGSVVAKIAEEMDMDPKVARSRMRRRFGKQTEGKWPTDIATIKEVLKEDARKKKD